MGQSRAADGKAGGKERCVPNECQALEVELAGSIPTPASKLLSPSKTGDRGTLTCHGASGCIVVLVAPVLAVRDAIVAMSGTAGAEELALRGSASILVTDASSRMPWPGTQCITQPLHHGEVLWHVATMQRVGGLLRKLP